MSERRWQIMDNANETVVEDDVEAHGLVENMNEAVVEDDDGDAA